MADLRPRDISYMRLGMLKNTVQTLRRLARRPLGRTLFFCALLIAVLAVAFRVATPFLISTDSVRESMEQSVSEWTGHSATIGGVSTIRFWPEPEVTLSDITIRRKTEAGDAVLATIPTLSASFPLTTALLGKPSFEDFHLVNPHIFLSRNADGHLRWTDGGLLMEAIGKAGQAGGGQTLASEHDATLGEMLVTNGTIEIANESDGHVTRLEAINGTLDWPKLSSAAAIDAQASFRGKRISIDISTTQPLLLLSGRNGQFDGTLSADLGMARLSGLASFTARGYFSGDAEVRSSDIPATLRWLDIDPALLTGLNSASVAAKIVADHDDLRFENLSMGLNDEHATGLLELDTPDNGLPRLSGTLAFDRIDFLRLLTAMEPAISNDRSGRPSLAKRLELDLRISAGTAALGPLQLQDVALGLMHIGQQFRLDILDAGLQPGSMTGRIYTIRDATAPDAVGGQAGATQAVPEQTAKEQAVAIRLSVRGADFAAITSQLKLAGPLPAAQGSLDISIDVPRPINRDAWDRATGTAQFTAGAGTLNGVHMATIRQLAAQKTYFPLSDAAGGSFDFDGIKATAVLHNGIANIRDAEISGRQETVALAGAVPLMNGSFALSAIVRAKAAGTDPLSFFIGGGWPNPVLWPTSVPIAAPSPVTPAAPAD